MKFNPDSSPDRLGKVFRAKTEVDRHNTLVVDLKEFEHFLEGSGMNDAQKEEFLGIMWNIIVNFVDLGFGIHPVQDAMESNTELNIDYDEENVDNHASSEMNIIEEFAQSALPAPPDTSEPEVP